MDDQRAGKVKKFSSLASPRERQAGRKKKTGGEAVLEFELRASCLPGRGFTA
jgi:hypothetical protein